MVFFTRLKALRPRGVLSFWSLVRVKHIFNDLKGIFEPMKSFTAKSLPSVIEVEDPASGGIIAGKSSINVDLRLLFHSHV